MRNRVMALVIGVAVSLPSLAVARTLEADCTDPGKFRKQGEQACLILLGQKGLSVAEQLRLHRLRADLLEGLYDHGIALIEVGHILRLAPDDLEALMQKARLLDKLGEHDKAMAMIKAAEAENPDDMRLVRAEFDLRSRNDNGRAAEDVAATAIMRFPRAPEGYMMRAEVLIKRKNFRFAMDDVHTAILYGDTSKRTLKILYNLCQSTKGPCPQLFPPAHIEGPQMSCQQARDWLYARTLEKPPMVLDGPNKSLFEGRYARKFAEYSRRLERDLEEAIVEGGPRLGVVAVSAYVGATISFTTNQDVGSAVRVVASEALVRCFFDEDWIAQKIVADATAKNKYTFDDLFHQAYRDAVFDHAYHVLQSDRILQ